MPATLGDGGELERAFRRRKITRIPVPAGSPVNQTSSSTDADFTVRASQTPGKSSAPA